MMTPMCREAQGWEKGTWSQADLNAYVDASWGHRISKTVCSMIVCVWERSGRGEEGNEKERVMDCWDQTKRLMNAREMFSTGDLNIPGDLKPCHMPTIYIYNFSNHYIFYLTAHAWQLFFSLNHLGFLTLIRKNFWYASISLSFNKMLGQ